MTGSAFTGRSRRRKTTRAVKIAETVSRTLITLGGMGTIVAVSTIFLFLLYVVLPLFDGAELEPAEGAPRVPVADAQPLAVGLDEQQIVAWAVLDDARALAFRVSDGTLLEARPLFGDDLPSVLRVSPQGEVAASFPDGSVQFGRVGIGARFLDEGELPGLVLPPADGEGDPPRERSAIHGAGLVQLTPEGQLSKHTLEVELDERVAAEGAPIVLLAKYDDGATRGFCALRADGTLGLERTREKRNLLTGKVTRTVNRDQLPYPGRPGHGDPAHLLLTERGAHVYLVWGDGFAMHFDNRGAEPALTETVRLVSGDGTRLTALDLMVGEGTLVVGDSLGNLRGWFLSRPRDDLPQQLTLAHVLEGNGAAVTALAASTRTRLFAAGFADGGVGLFHMTTEQVLGGARLAGSGPVGALAIAPRNDGLLAEGGGELRRWNVSADHPEVRAASLFRPVWYEGEARPVHVWQSSSGTDDFEPKLGMVPLVFGTLKATFYSMIFSVPLAILAAIYTSEFLSQRVRERVKQAIEMMATLPSVVLGFLAGIVLAPFIESSLASMLAVLFCVPFCWLLGAQLWQLLPGETAVRWSGWPRLLVIAAMVPVGFLLAAVAGPAAEAALFGGDLRAWLAGAGAQTFGGWWLVLLPFAAVAVFWASARWVTPWLRRTSSGWPRRRVALVDLGKFGLNVAAALLLAAGAAVLAQAFGWDPRTQPVVGQLDLAPVSTYVQLNAMVVGFVMGFAVVPIIYTLAEDALSAVPDHLRAASLATGATPWQTAVRVVVPTAMSGLFSAVMIGLGRAVGETMIVLMAAGNTPLLEANIFNGFRTLAACIAVELPEAVQDGSLYRVLFLAAMTLFAMTFLINTFAELVRMRFRKRAYEL